MKLKDLEKEEGTTKLQITDIQEQINSEEKKKASLTTDQVMQKNIFFYKIIKLGIR